MLGERALRAAVVGCRMGAIHAQILAQLAEFDLVSVCDLDEPTAQKVASETGAPRIYTDYARMLEQERPEVVTIATPTALHAAMTFQAIEAGVRGICCEKPMATNLADGREMVELCRKKGIALVVNHQRRMGADLVAMREAIEQGEIGELLAIRAHCAGDLLSDGTHAVDSALWLLGDSEAEWVVAQIHRQLSPSFSGFRYGHPVESGAMVLVRFTNGVRLELFTGDFRDPLRAYQDYEAFGTKGRLWRVGDKAQPNLFIADGTGGDWVAQRTPDGLRPVQQEGKRRGEWRPVPLPMMEAAMVRVYRQLARMIWHGEDHPLAGEKGLRGLEILMAAYESARCRRKISLPITQDAFPLELMLREQGELP
ncbi:MAG: hypothetical protein RJAPGHWK_000022 [Candidatus Fervidibacter sp.]